MFCQSPPVILTSLGLMTVAHFRRRARKARKQPRGSSYFSEPESVIPKTEMSQTQNSPPLTSSAPLVHRPEPLHFLNSSSTSNTTSLSALMPELTFLDTTTSNRRPLSTSEFDGNFDEPPSDPLPSPFETHDLSLDTPRPERAVSVGHASSSTSNQLSPFDLSLDTTGPPLSSTSGQLSSLHRDMVGFQKTLEADHKADIADQSQSTIISDPIVDPPPEYIGYLHSPT